MAEHLPGTNADVEALRRFACVKLIAADLDGTFLPSEFAGKAERLLRQLDHAGVQMTVATGRTFHGVRDLLIRLHSPRGKPLIKRGTPLILYNGSVVIEAGIGRLLYRKTMPDAALSFVAQIAARHSCDFFAYSCEETVLGIDENHRVQEHVVGWQFGPGERKRSETEFNGLPVEWRTTLPCSVPFEACAVVINSLDCAVLTSIASQLQDLGIVSVTRSSSLYLEIRPESSNKGKALAYVAQRFNLLPAQVLAVGDSDNDVEMLKWAGIGVAVSTASTSAKEQADFLCDYGPFQGMVQVLGLVHAAHRYFRDSHKGDPAVT